MAQTPTSPAASSSTLREACADLVRRLRAGEAARAEHYFDAFPGLAAQAETAVELIYTEYAACEELGRPADDGAFIARFPQWADKLRRQFDIHRLLSEDQSPPRESPSAPERLGAYEIVRPLGRGGMGTVYLATHGELGRLAAVKILHGAGRAASRSSSANSLVERFRVEVRAAAALGHPQIVQLYELGETSDGRLFAAFEFVEGGSLRQAINGRPRPAREAAALLRRLAEGIDCAHRAGIVHCDLTPANVLLARDGTPKIADFGLAKLRRAEGAAGDDSSSAADAATAPADSAAANSDDAALSSVALAGTPGYLAPERIDQPDEAKPAADIYGLGAIFYELLTGRPPYVGATPLETLRQARDYDPPSPRALVPNIPHDAATICLKCLERNPASRYDSAAALADDLRRFLDGEPIAARPVGAIERAWKWAKRRPGLAAASATTAAALLALVVGGAWYNLRLREALDRTVAQQQQIATQAQELSARVASQRRDLFTLQLNQAEALLERAPHRSRQLLDDPLRCPLDLRDFAWGLMMRRASQERRTLLGHGGGVWCVAVADDGTITSAAVDDTVRRWTRDADQPTATIDAATSEAALLSLASDGRRLAVAAPDGRLRTFNLQGPTAIERALEGHPCRIVALVFFADSKWLASAGEDGEVRLWDPAGTLVARYAAAEPGQILSLAASPDGGLLAVGLAGGNVSVLDANDVNVRRELEAAGGALASFTDDGKQLLTSNLVDGRIVVWDTADWQRKQVVNVGGDVLRSFVVSRDGRRLAYATAEQVVRVVDLLTLRELAEYRGHADRIGMLAFADNGRLLVTASDDRTLKLWDVPGRRLPEFVAGDDLKTLCTAFSADGRRIAVAGFDAVVRVADVPGGDDRGAADEQSPNVLRLAGHSAAIHAVAFLPDGRLLSAGEDRTVRLWDPATEQTVRTWEHPDWVMDLVVVDAATFDTACADGIVRRFTLDAAEPVAKIAAHSQTIQRLARSRDGGLRATASRDGTIKVWRPDGAQAAALNCDGRVVVGLAFSPDGLLLAAGDDAGLVTIWDISRPEPQLVRELRGHAHGVYDLAFSPDGKLLATATGGRWVQTTGEVKLWDTATGQIHATLADCMAPLAFRPDGRMLAVTQEPRRRVAIWSAVEF